MQSREVDWTDSDTRNVNLCRGISLDILAEAGRAGLNIGIDEFGASGGSDALMEKYGFTVAKVQKRICEKLRALEISSQ